MLGDEFGGLHCRCLGREPSTTQHFLILVPAPEAPTAFVSSDVDPRASKMPVEIVWAFHLNEMPSTLSVSACVAHMILYLRGIVSSKCIHDPQ